MLAGSTRASRASRMARRGRVMRSPADFRWAQACSRAEAGFTPVLTVANVKTGVKPASALEQACAHLKSAGLRITRPRLAILEALLARVEPASIEQIHEMLGTDKCDLVTVYRCM